jgi:hypothetical protein
MDGEKEETSIKNKKKAIYKCKHLFFNKKVVLNLIALGNEKKLVKN